MQERRRLKRKCAIGNFRLSFEDYFIRVFDENTSQLAGHLVDITSEGMRLVSEKPIETDTAFHFRMDFPEAANGGNPVAFDAESLWCSRNADSASYHAGFRFQNFSRDNIEAIEHPSRSHLFQH